MVARAAGQLGWGSTAPATSIRSDADDLAWHRVDVDGRTVVYGEGGSGPTVLFLHGWALGSRTYKRTLRRLVARGCRVLAPAMPGFGGSDPMPGPTISIAGYGDWAVRFLDAVGVADPAVVIGHSLGGGVSVMLASRHPDRVRYLVLVNAVGGATWDGREGRTLSDRSLGGWAVEFGRDLFPLSDGLTFLGAVGQDLVSGLLRNPYVVSQAATLARTADLTAELHDLRATGIPVLALTSERDNVIPGAAFDTLCAALGTEGRVVTGGHSWLLTDPDHFDDVVRNVVDVHVDAHRVATAEAAGAEVRALLDETTIPPAIVDRLLDGAPPLWLTSNAPTVLATDLALCHPCLEADEVRAVAQPIPLLDELAGGSSLRLTVVAADRGGLLADTCAVLADRGLSVESATAMTWPTLGLALHSLIVHTATPLDAADFACLGDELRAMHSDRPVPEFTPIGQATVSVSGVPARRATVTVSAKDQLGLLWAICQWFADADVSIEAVAATTAYGVARDSFIVVGDCLPDALATALSAGAGPSRRFRLVDAG